MNVAEKYNWNETRQKGKLRFVFLETLLVGFSGAILSTSIDYFFEFFLNDKPNYLHESENFVFKIFLRLIIFSIAGFLIGNYLWNKNEDHYVQNSEGK